MKFAIDLTQLPEFGTDHVDLRDLLDALKAGAVSRETAEALQQCLELLVGAPRSRYLTKEKFCASRGLTSYQLNKRIERYWTKGVEYGTLDGALMIDTEAVDRRWEEKLRAQYVPPMAVSKSATPRPLRSPGSGSPSRTSSRRKLT